MADALVIILTLAVVAAPVALLVGMISPRLVLPRLVLRGNAPTRKKVLAVYVAAFFICGIAGGLATSQTDEYKARVAAEEAERVRLEAEAKAAAKRVRQEQLAAEEAARKAEAKQKAKEEARCRTDLQCWGDKNALAAAFACDEWVEKLALNSFEWTDSWLEPKFSHFRWQDQQRGVVTFIGDKIMYQDGFGAMINHVYECDYNPTANQVVDVRATPGRL